MKKIISSIIFIFSIALLSIFITILVSENSNIVSYLYKHKIAKEVEDKIYLEIQTLILEKCVEMTISRCILSHS